MIWSDKVNETNVVDRAKHMLDQWLATQMEFSECTYNTCWKGKTVEATIRDI